MRQIRAQLSRISWVSTDSLEMTLDSYGSKCQGLAPVARKTFYNKIKLIFWTSNSISEESLEDSPGTSQRLSPRIKIFRNFLTFIVQKLQLKIFWSDFRLFQTVQDDLKFRTQFIVSKNQAGNYDKSPSFQKKWFFNFVYKSSLCFDNKLSVILSSCCLYISFYFWVKILIQEIQNDLDIFSEHN